MVPTMLPILDMDPNQLASSIVSFPDSNGVLSDCKIGSVGLSHPIAQPWPSTTMLAVMVN